MRKLVRKLVCLILSLFLFVTFSFADFNVPLEKQNYLLEKKSRFVYILPSLLACSVSYWLWSESDKPKNEEHRLGIRIMSGSLALVGLIFFGEALTPKKVFLFPKLGEDGKTIWFEKEVVW